MRERQQNSTAHPIPFYMTLIGVSTPGTGLTPVVTLSKDGGAFAAAAGAVSEIANGWYAVAGNATDRSTLGSLILHATATGCDPTDAAYDVTGFDPYVNQATGDASGRATPTPTSIASIASSILASPSNLLATDSVGRVTPVPQSTLLGGLIVSGSTAATVTVSGLPAGNSYIGQALYNLATGETRNIAGQSYAGGNYTFTLGTTTGEDGPFSVISAGATIIPIP